MEIEVCSSSEPETELGVAIDTTSATAPSIDSGALLGLNNQENEFSEFLLPKCSMLLASIMLKIMLVLSAKGYPATTSVSNNRPSVIRCKAINSVTVTEIPVQLEPIGL